MLDTCRLASYVPKGTEKQAIVNNFLPHAGVA